MSRHWINRSLTGLISTAFNFTALTSTALIVAAPVRAEWSPLPEPAVWSEVRRRELAGDGWRFVEATRTDQLQAAEYLRHPRAVGQTVELEAGLLLRRSGQPAWTSRVLPMRAICTEGRMERKAADGQWAPYPGRPGTAVKVRWICALP